MIIIIRNCIFKIIRSLCPPSDSALDGCVYFMALPFTVKLNLRIVLTPYMSVVMLEMQAGKQFSNDIRKFQHVYTDFENICI